MAPNWLDHVFVVVMVLIIPLHSKFTFPAILEDVRRRGEPALVAAYQQVIATFAIAGAVVVFLWYWYGREWSQIGFQTGSLGSQLTAFAIATVFVVALLLPIRAAMIAVESGTRDGSEFETQMGELQVFMPKSAREEAWFYGVSINAGITEELIFRGYLIWYLQHFVNTWTAGLIAVALFGFAHIYQGLKQLPGILLTSAVAVTVYLISDSLLVPIVTHIAVDAMQGRYIARIRRAKDDVASA